MMKKVFLQMGSSQLILEDRATYLLSDLMKLVNIVSCDYKSLSEYETKGRVRFSNEDGSFDLQLTILDGKSILSDESRGILLVLDAEEKFWLRSYYGNTCDKKVKKDGLRLLSRDSKEENIRSIFDYMKSQNEENEVKIIITYDKGVFERLSTDSNLSDYFIFFAV